MNAPLPAERIARACEIDSGLAAELYAALHRLVESALGPGSVSQMYDAANEARETLRLVETEATFGQAHQQGEQQ